MHSNDCQLRSAVGVSGNFSNCEMQLLIYYNIPSSFYIPIC